MMYELFGFELSDFKGLFYVFCLAVLVYRYITVGHKYPLFSRREKETNTAKTVDTDEASKTEYVNPDFLNVRLNDYIDYRSEIYWNPTDTDDINKH
ncbi:TPA: hypothetical protein I8Y18_003475 [Raoultella ornithinolytica]|nr:hypothetical protein [Raoultella ornithinolytica]